MKGHGRRILALTSSRILHPLSPSLLRRTRAALLLLFLFSLPYVVRAQLPSPYPSWAAKQIYVQSPPKVISLTLQQKAAAATVIGRIGVFFDQFSRKVDEATIGKAQGGDDQGDVDKATCNMQASDQANSWASKAATYLALRGLKKCETNCSTEREVGSALAGMYDLEADLPRWAEILNESAIAVAKSAGRDWGTNVSGVSRFKYPDRENQNCTLWHTMGVRVDEQWYVQARVTREIGDIQPKRVDADNAYLVEHLTVDSNGRLASLPLQLPINDNATSFKKSSTSYEVWSRPSPDSVGVNADVSRNIAFRAALAKGDDEHQQAQDAEQVSNTAILLLPLAMNLVPVALIADVNTFGMLLYTALTDVLTTVPLCIKGIELINISRSRYRAASAQITGNRKLNETMVAEAWVAECRLKARHSYFQRGVIFVVLSISLMIFGVACEFVAKWWVKRRRSFLNDNNLPLVQNHHNYYQHLPQHQHNMGAGVHHTAGPNLSHQQQQPGYQYSQGHTTAHQPFAAAALAMQNRQYRDGDQGITSANRSVVSSHGPPLQRHPQVSTHGPSLQRHPHHVHNHGSNNNGFGSNCICACHTSGQGPIRPEYDSRATPDQMARKYH